MAKSKNTLLVEATCRRYSFLESWMGNELDLAKSSCLRCCVTSEILRGSSVWSQLTAFSVGLFRLAFYDLASDESFKHSRLKYIIIEDFMEVLSMPAGWSTTNKGPDDLFVQICENLMYIASRDTFPDKYSVRHLLSVPYTHTLLGFFEGDREFWVNRFNTCNRRGIRIEVSRGVIEWVEDKWMEIPSMN
ncbi:hypothetical protein CPB84DRAFT_1820790 [Gymnopilus junonius]|uniref:Uncharacterized protein n=1 Tax=Gymnopilus junonius TaxID=109634 RepID=A0A9P5NZL8_GYMJU|nr:hypothetical protein CPB84DRAFT_1820790 [Gymnopilus junonius]